MSEQANDQKGWGFVMNSRKAHYFNGEGTSLCGRWLILSRMHLEDDNHNSPDNCAECKRRKAKQEDSDA